MTRKSERYKPAVFPSATVKSPLLRSELIELLIAIGHDRVAVLMRIKVWETVLARDPINHLARLTIDGLRKRLTGLDVSEKDVESDLAALPAPKRAKK